MLHSSHGSDGASAMDSSSSSSTYYPIYMHKAHPLHGAWVKLSAKLVGDLVVPLGWESSHPAINVAGAAPLAVSPKFPLFYYLNHPLPYVQLCGVVVEITERFSFTELRLDDSSGVLATALFKKWVDPEETAKQQDASDATEAKPGDLLTIPIPVKKDIRYCGWLNDNTFDIQDIRIGSVLRIKGRASFWKLGTQILIEKYDVFRSTSQEIEFWRSMSRDFENVLSKPWLLADQRVMELEADFQRAKNAKEKQMAQMRRRARRERKEKEAAAAADGDRKGKKRSGDMARSGKLARTSIDAVLAPSYQIPQKGSSSETKSSLNSQPLELFEGSTDATLSIRPNMEIGGYEAQNRKTIELLHKETGLDQTEEFTTSRLLASAQDSSLLHRTRSLAAAGDTKSLEWELVDTSLPSGWKQIELTADANSTRLIHGAEWLTLHNNLSSRRLSSEDKQPKKLREKAPTYSVTDEWNDVVL